MRIRPEIKERAEKVGLGNIIKNTPERMLDRLMENGLSNQEAYDKVSAYFPGWNREEHRPE